MKILCVIGARGGSQGVPGKNILPLLGKPLIAWSIEQALATPEVDRVVVSTDSEEIAAAAREAGAETPFMRPAALSGPDVGKFQVWQHALEASEAYYHENYDTYLDLDCTNPLRDVADISNALRQFETARTRGVDAVFSVCRSRKNPYFNMVEADDSGALRLSKRPEKFVLRRQDQPVVFDIVASIYVLDPVFIRHGNYLFEGRTEGYDIGEAKSFDVDSEIDFNIIEMLMRERYAPAS